MCHGFVDVPAVEARNAIAFDDYFAREWKRLQLLQADGLIELDGKHITLTPVGRLLMRTVAMVFDAYLDVESQPAPMSRVI
jgi:oxygen-independent coproporphyrinogen-3 oxidase